MSIFSRILDGSIPCHRVYEDDLTLAFLDINPLAPGHTLVIPKEAQATVMDLSEESAAGIGRVLPRITRAACAAASRPTGGSSSRGLPPLVDRRRPPSMACACRPRRRLARASSTRPTRA